MQWVTELSVYVGTSELSSERAELTEARNQRPSQIARRVAGNRQLADAQPQRHQANGGLAGYQNNACHTNNNS